MTTLEQWKIIDGHENYEISNTGYVRNRKTGRILKPWINDQGYCFVELCNKNKNKTISIHRIIAKAFIENPAGLKCVDHIDGNRQNNRIENLRWATDSQNQANTEKHSNNTSGIKGVHWHKHVNKWFAEIRINNKRYHLGYFNYKEKAGFVYEFFAKALHKEFARITREFNKFYTPELFEKILQIKTKYGFTF